jgi:hypothetical protein
MILRQDSATSLFSLELRSDEALNIISQLSQALETAQRNHFPQTVKFPASFTLDYSNRHYANVMHFRVEPNPDRDAGGLCDCTSVCKGKCC